MTGTDFPSLSSAHRELDEAARGGGSRRPVHRFRAAVARARRSCRTSGADRAVPAMPISKDKLIGVKYRYRALALLVTLCLVARFNRKNPSVVPAVAAAPQAAELPARSTGRFRQALKWLGVAIVFAMGVFVALYLRYIISAVPASGPHALFVGSCAVALGAFFAAISSLKEFNSTPPGKIMQFWGLLVAYCGAALLAGAAAADAWPLPICSEFHSQDLQTKDPYIADRLDEMRRENKECLST